MVQWPVNELLQDSFYFAYDSCVLNYDGFKVLGFDIFLDIGIQLVLAYHAGYLEVLDHLLDFFVVVARGRRQSHNPVTELQRVHHLGDVGVSVPANPLVRLIL